MKKTLIIGSDENGKLITHNYRAKKQTVKKDQQLRQTAVSSSSLESDELLDKPNFCRIAKCKNCNRTIAVAVWDDKVSEETKKEFDKMEAKGYLILGVTLREARNQDLFHSQDCHLR